MSVLYIVVPMALVIVGVALAGYLWAVRNGQMDDLETPGLRVIRDDE
jgi:cbb3-type cytochrome oxidase maturation protein